jgi:cytochrome bd-type quinol oxidase subunit 1
MVLLSLVVFTLLYGALMAADVYLLAKFARSETAGDLLESSDPSGGAGELGLEGGA